MGIRRPPPNALVVTHNPRAACLCLNLLRSTARPTPANRVHIVPHREDLCYRQALQALAVASPSGQRRPEQDANATEGARRPG